MTILEDFINKFHNLGGICLKERNKSFHCLLRSLETPTSYNLDTLIEKLQPATYLEETFKIELLIYFKRFTDLLNVLMSGEEMGACKIIKQHWFVRELMEKYEPIQFVEELVPNFSLCVRTKIFKKILIHVTDESKVEELFQELHKTYGLMVAAVLLPGCSTGIIKECLKNNPINLSSSQLKLLFVKDRSLIITYFEELRNDEKDVDNYKCASFFNYVAIKDPLFYFELTEKFSIFRRQLGRKSTKKFIDIQRRNILEKPKVYIQFLRKDSLVRKFGEDFPELYRKMLPKTLSNFEYRMAKSLIKYYNKDKQYELYRTTFEETYNKSLWDNTNYMDERLIELIPDKEEREKWITKFENRVNIKKYTARKKYARYQCAMTFIEDSDTIVIKERKTIFNTLISTCKLTKDYDAFLNILKSFCERHRNSDVTILYNFLRTVHKELDMKKLNAKHWKYIYRIIEIQLFKKQQIFHPIFVEYIKFLYLQNEPIEKYVHILLNEVPLNLFNFEYGNEKFQKSMLQIYMKLLPENSNKEKLVIQIALSVIEWNQKHSINEISMLEQQNVLISALKLKSIEKINPDTKKVFKYLICQQNGNQEISELDRIYWENFKILNDDTITKWFAKYKPAVLKENLDKVGIMLKAKNSLLIRTLKKYDHMNIPSTITSLCLEELRNCQTFKKGRIVRILVMFMVPKDLLIFLKDYMPEIRNSNATLVEEEKQSLYEIQCALAKYLKLTVNLKEFLPELLKYCQSYILGSALTSLYSSFCRIPENQLYSAIEELSAQAVSVRKHSIFLSSLILPVEKVLFKYKQIQSSEKHTSVKQHMFLSCYKYFLKNGLQECWIIMVQYIALLERNQKDVIKLLTNVDKVPKKYRSVFAQHAWKTFNKLKKENVKLDDYMISLLRNLGKKDVVALPDEFCLDVIGNKLFDLEKCSMEHCVFDFTRKLLLYGENAGKNIHVVFKALRNFRECWIDGEKRIEVLKIVNQFCFDLFEDFLRDEEKEINKNFPELYREAWSEEFIVDETFEENLMINFVLRKTEPKRGTESFSELMNEFFSVALEKYGNLVITNFKSFLSDTFDIIYKGDDKNIRKIDFFLTFLEKNCSTEHCILVIELLPPCIYVEGAENEYKKILETLLQKDEIVRIRLYGKLKSEDY